MHWLRKVAGTIVVVALVGAMSMAPVDGTADGSSDTNAITYLSRSVTYSSKKYAFQIVRIDLQGNGIHVIPVASPAGMNTSVPYTVFAALGKPLAMINGLPFNTTTHETTGSLGGGGIIPQIKAGYAETLGVDARGIPFYGEGRLDVYADITAAGVTTSLKTYSINSVSWGGFTVYTNWYPRSVWIGGNEALVVVDHGTIVQRVRGATFQPHSMKSGWFAVHGYQTAVNHWTTDTITPLLNADHIRLRIMLGNKDISTGFFIQSAPVVLRAGRPVNGAALYPTSVRMTKAGARSFLGIGGGRYLYFISSATPISLRTDNVGAALARLRLFSDVISLDGGGSTTLYCKGKYIYTPYRRLVTCLVAR